MYTVSFSMYTYVILIKIIRVLIVPVLHAYVSVCGPEKWCRFSVLWKSGAATVSLLGLGGNYFHENIVGTELFSRKCS